MVEMRVGWRIENGKEIKKKGGEWKQKTPTCIFVPVG